MQMVNSGFGFGGPFGPPVDFQQWAKLWAPWVTGQAPAPAANPFFAPPPTAPWQPAANWWGGMAAPVSPPANDVGAAIEQFRGMASDWLNRLQQFAPQVPGMQPNTPDPTQMWKQAWDALQNYSPWQLGAAQAPPSSSQSASPWLDGWYQQLLSSLSLPAFGFAREDQEHAQAFLRAQIEYQRANTEYLLQIANSVQLAFGIFQSKLAALAEARKTLDSPQALFNLWIDAAEEGYAQVAMSPEFGNVYGQLVDTQMRLRAVVQKSVEEACAKLGMPTRSELDSAHSRVVALERQVRRLVDTVDEQSRALRDLTAALQDVRASGVEPLHSGDAAETERPKAVSAQAANAEKSVVRGKKTKPRKTKSKAKAKRAVAADETAVSSKPLEPVVASELPAAPIPVEPQADKGGSVSKRAVTTSATGSRPNRKKTPRSILPKATKHPPGPARRAPTVSRTHRARRPIFAAAAVNLPAAPQPINAGSKGGR